MSECSDRHDSGVRICDKCYNNVYYVILGKSYCTNCHKDEFATVLGDFFSGKFGKDVLENHVFGKINYEGVTMSECKKCGAMMEYFAVDNEFRCPKDCDKLVESFGTLGIIEMTYKADGVRSLRYYISETDKYMILAQCSDGSCVETWKKDLYNFKKVTVQ